MTGPIHPFYRTILDRYAEAGRPYFHQVKPAEARALLKAGAAAAPPPRDLPPLASVRDELIPGAENDIAIRRYLPFGGVSGICVYLHAGGWIMGDLDFSDATCRRLCAMARCELVSVDYRLAPEHPFPAALDDAFSVVRWAAARAAGPVIVAGESSGGNVAAACAIRARDEGGPHIAGQLLAYPVTDHSLDTASHKELGPRNLLLSTADMRSFWDCYCPRGVNRDDALVSPLRAVSLEGLPSAFILVAELDPLRDEGLAYAARLAAAGVTTLTRSDAGMLHGYLGAAGDLAPAAEALADVATWMFKTVERAAELAR